MKNVLTVLLAGGVGARLHPLTRHRAKPAVPFGGQFRIVDFTLSNCLNSECSRIHVLVQYKSLSLVRHIRQGWNSVLNQARGEYIETIAPQMRVNDNWYQGTADALFHNLYSIEKADPKEVLILSGDHVYKMDYQKMIHFHRQREADVTIATIPVPIEEASQFGVLAIDAERRVNSFAEKPVHPAPLPNDPERAMASMGIYVFNPEVLKTAVIEDSERNSSHDFGRDIIPELIEHKNVYAYPFQDENKKESMYWRDVGTLDAYWEANMDLAQVDPLFNLYDKEWPVHTYAPVLPPAKFVFASPGQRYGVAVDSIVCNGCIVSGGMVKRSVLSPGVRVNTGADVDECILFSGSSIGRHARVRRAIIEKNVSVPSNAVIGYNLEEDAKWHRVSPTGIVVVESMDQRMSPAAR